MADHYAIDPGTLQDQFERLLAAVDCGYLQMIFCDGLDDALPMPLVSGRHHQGAGIAFHDIAQLGQRLAQRIFPGCLLHEAERSQPHALVIQIVNRDHACGNVSRFGVMPQEVEDIPAVHVRELDVQRHDIGRELLRKRERRVRIERDQSLDALFMQPVQKVSGNLHVISYDYSDPVTGQDVAEVVVRDCRAARRTLRRLVLACALVLPGKHRQGVFRARRFCQRAVAVGPVNKWDVKRKSAPFTGAAFHPNIAAEQTRQFGTDRKAKACPSKLAAGRSVGLLERFENDLLLFKRNADAGVADRERHGITGLVEQAAPRRPAGCHHRNLE